VLRVWEFQKCLCYARDIAVMAYLFPMVFAPVKHAVDVAMVGRAADTDVGLIVDAGPDDVGDPTREDVDKVCKADSVARHEYIEEDNKRIDCVHPKGVGRQPVVSEQCPECDGDRKCTGLSDRS
jgi:hypothetical protein